jgi:hypothetical protein
LIVNAIFVQPLSEPLGREVDWYYDPADFAVAAPAYLVSNQDNVIRVGPLDIVMRQLPKLSADDWPRSTNGGETMQIKLIDWRIIDAPKTIEHISSTASSAPTATRC